ncbi:MAG UNVERIFIED_CONTAM: ATP-binding cassette domain-containing protein [Anaerolineae bacterium]
MARTTLFNIMAGLLHPTGGTVYFGDQLLYGLTEAQRDHFRAQHIGYIFQQHFLIQSLSALENVRMPMRFANRLSPAQATEKAVHLLRKSRAEVTPASPPQTVEHGATPARFDCPCPSKPRQLGLGR